MKFLILSFLLVSGLSGLGRSTAKASVWTSENKWDASWEDKFSDWVQASWDDEIFMRADSVLYQVPTDCADASYSMRALFSYLNRLPFQIKNTVKKNIQGEFLTNEMGAYDKFPEGDARFREFVKFINRVTNSETLADDTYPIEMTRKYMRAGAIYVAPNDHTYQVKSIDNSGVPLMYSSTVPKEVRYLQILKSFPMYIPEKFSTFKDGFRVFKQPDQYARIEKELPGYGTEQFEISKRHNENILTFGDEIASKLAVVPETMPDKMHRALLNMCYFSQTRGIIIAWTLVRKAQNRNRCFTKDEYEAESTTSRDKKLKLMYDYAEQLTNDPNYSSVVSPYKPFYDYIFKNAQLENAQLINWCGTKAPILNLPDYSLKDIWDAMKSNQLIDDPNATLGQRWGVESYTPTCSKN